MLVNRFNYFQIIIFLFLLTAIGCNSANRRSQNTSEEKSESSSIDSLEPRSYNSSLIDTLELIVVQNANGYEYAMHNYDFNPTIETELNKFENIKVKRFPHKTLAGVAYQGVFDKKYCLPIIKKVDVDFLILTRFDKRYDELRTSEMKWGYELRVVNTATLDQINSISAYNLHDYSEIEKHIQENIETLKSDIEKLKKVK